LNAREEHCKTGPTLPGKCGIDALPFEGGCIKDTSQSAVVDRVHTNIIFNVVRQPFGMPVGVTTGAGKLPVERIFGAVENAFTESFTRDNLWSAQIDRSNRFQRFNINYAYGILQGIRYKEPRPLTIQCKPPGTLTDIDLLYDKLCGRP
jgi:hypothetical protein